MDDQGQTRSEGTATKITKTDDEFSSTNNNDDNNENIKDQGEAAMSKFLNKKEKERRKEKYRL